MESDEAALLRLSRERSSLELQRADELSILQRIDDALGEHQRELGKVLAVLSRMEGLLEQQRNLLHELSRGCDPNPRAGPEHRGVGSELRDLHWTIRAVAYVPATVELPLIFVVILLAVIAWRVW